MFSLLDHHLPANQSQNTLVSASLAMGIDTWVGNWVQARHYTPILSALVTSSKLIVLYKAELNPCLSHENDPANGMIPLFDMVRDMAVQTLKPTSMMASPHPIDCFIGLCNYSNGYSRRQPEDAVIS